MADGSGGEQRHRADRVGQAAGSTAFMFKRQTCANSDRYMAKGTDSAARSRQAAYKAAQAKNQDQVLDAAEKITTACSTCHDPYREKTPRCSQ